mmetsp:Transcript_43810/g.106241  ORF Transcript_43810/g.106241 Transcript_43810/m.106241 type:complete len:91 (-) Transcript_43810:75-347(-)
MCLRGPIAVHVTAGCENRKAIDQQNKNTHNQPTPPSLSRSSPSPSLPSSSSSLVSASSLPPYLPNRRSTGRYTVGLTVLLLLLLLPFQYY